MPAFPGRSFNPARGSVLGADAAKVAPKKKGPAKKGKAKKGFDLLDDLAMRQRHLQSGDPLVRHLRPLQREPTQAQHPMQVVQPGVGNLGAGQRQPGQVRQLADVLQASVSDRHFVQFQQSQSGGSTDAAHRLTVFSSAFWLSLYGWRRLKD